MAYQLKGGEEIINGILFGWTGRECSACNGTGECDDSHFGGLRTCQSCGGTGGEWGRMPEHPKDLVK
jgi:DnaJ-class molecular chaperone